MAAFQLALALGAPWGQFAMGGALPGTHPTAMRLAAILQIIVLGVFALIVLARAGLFPRDGRRTPRALAWLVVGLTGLGFVLNLITPSPLKRAIWAPVALGLLATSMRVAVSR